MSTRKPKIRGKNPTFLLPQPDPTPKKWHQNPNLDLNFGYTKTQKPRNLIHHYRVHSSFIYLIFNFWPPFLGHFK